jgi:hypothetical protein
MPRLVKFVLKWNAIGILLGWLVLAAMLLADVSGIGSMISNSPHGMIAGLVLALSFAVTSGPVAVTVAVLLSREFGDAEPANDRQSRWKSGQSAELERDAPLP